MSAAETDAGAGDLKLRDCLPHPALRVAEHLVERAARPAVDAHDHLGRRLPADGDWAVADVPRLPADMDAAHVRAIIDLDGRWGAELEADLERYDRRHPAGARSRAAGNRACGRPCAARQSRNPCLPFSYYPAPEPPGPPRPSRRGRRARRGRPRARRARPARERWLQRALCFPQGSAFPCLPPRRPSLRVAVYDEKVEDAVFSTGSASPPRSAVRRERFPPGAPPAMHPLGA